METSSLSDYMSLKDEEAEKIKNKYTLEETYEDKERMLLAFGTEI
jgi:hypothetical protein